MEHASLKQYTPEEKMVNKQLFFNRNHATGVNHDEETEQVVDAKENRNQRSVNMICTATLIRR